VTPEELRILQVLGRIKKGDEQGIAILAGLSEETTCTLLNSLARKKITVHQINKRISRSKSRVPKMDSHPLWVNSSKGNSQALRSWGVPVRTSFRNRFEEHLPQIDTKHRRISRAGIAWLKAAWPYAEIWTGWSEVRIPDTYVVPDALAWGRIHGYETLIWLEVGDEHKSRKTIKDVTIKRLRKAHFLCKRTGARLVYVQLSPRWVLEAAGSVCRGLPQEVAVVLGGWRRFGKLPIVEWGQVTKWY